MSSNKCLVTLALAAMVVVVCATPSMGATFTWIGENAEGEWNEETNWSPTGVPGADDDVIHDGSGAGVIIVTGTDTACFSFTATAGGNPPRGLRINDQAEFQLGDSAELTGGMVVNGQTDEVRYLTELRFRSKLFLRSADGGDFLLQPHSRLQYNTCFLHFRNGVWRLAGGEFHSTEGECSTGFPGEPGKITIESGGAWHAFNADVHVAELEIHPGGVFWTGFLSPEVRVTNHGGYIGATTINVDPNDTEPAELRFVGGGRARRYQEGLSGEIQFRVGEGHSLVYEGEGNDLSVHRVLLADSESSGGGVIRRAASGATMRVGVADKLDIKTQGADFKDWHGRGVTVGATTSPTLCDPNAVATVEAYYPDLGCVFFEDVACNHWAQLYVERGATLHLVDNHVNAHRGDPNDLEVPAAERDAVYVRGSVVLEQDAEIDLGDLRIYHAGVLEDRDAILESQTGTGDLIPVRALKYGDFDGDCDVDLDDFGILNDFITSHGVPTAFPLGDADCDTDVDSNDFARFSQNFTAPLNACEPCGGQQEAASSDPPALGTLAEAMRARLSREQISAALSACGLRLQTMEQGPARSQLEDLIELLEEE